MCILVWHFIELSLLFFKKALKCGVQKVLHFCCFLQNAHAFSSYPAKIKGFVLLLFLLFCKVLHFFRVARKCILRLRFSSYAT